MNKENLTQLVVVLAALAVAIIMALWPTEAGTWSPIIVNQVVPVLCLLVAIFFPTGKAIEGAYKAHARAAYYNAVREGKLPPPAGAPTPQSIDETTIEGIMNWIKKDLEDGNIPYVDAAGELLPIPVAPQLLRQLTSRWNNPNVPMDIKMTLLQMTIDFASRAFKEGTGLESPAKYSECDDVQEYWFKCKPTCAIQSAALFRMVLAPLRDTLRIRDTGKI
ncbi:hypothetical protein M0R72_11510 [Candidatus Pacearchaeota archaeon]|jgi:hypothetical protein|nr:hypothetical protein [Candidatus Pacearchaeota archaeon]